MTPPEHRFGATTRRGSGLAVSPRHRGWVVLLLLAGMPAALLVLFAGEQSHPWTEVDSLWTWVRIGAEFMLAAPVHEAGHLAAGSIAGMRWGLFAVGPVIVRRYGAKVRLGWNPLALWGGASAVAAPPSGTVDEIVTGVRWAVAGGPAVSLIAGIVAWIAGYPVTPFTLASLGMGLVTLAPIGTGTDGARLLRLARGGSRHTCARRRTYGRRPAFELGRQVGRGNPGCPRSGSAEECPFVRLLPRTGHRRCRSGRRSLAISSRAFGWSVEACPCDLPPAGGRLLRGCVARRCGCSARMA